MWYKGETISGLFTVTTNKELVAKAYVSVISSPDNTEFAKFAYPAQTGFATATYSTTTGQLAFDITPEMIKDFQEGFRLDVEIKLLDADDKGDTAKFQGDLVLSAKTATYGTV